MRITCPREGGEEIGGGRGKKEGNREHEVVELIETFLYCLVAYRRHIWREGEKGGKETGVSGLSCGHGAFYWSPVNVLYSRNPDGKKKKKGKRG